MSPRRPFIAGTALLGAAAMLAGCSASTAPASTPDADPKGEVVFWSSLSGMADVVAAFNDSQDDITVTFEEIPNGANGGYTKLSAAIESGTGPDVVGIEYDRLPGFVASEQLTPLDDLVSADVIDAYDPQVRGLVSFADASYALPYDAPPLVMWYRQDVLEAAGVTVPTTWTSSKRRHVRSRPTTRTCISRASSPMSPSSPRSRGRPAPSGSASLTTSGRSPSMTRPRRRSPTTGST